MVQLGSETFLAFWVAGDKQAACLSFPVPAEGLAHGAPAREERRGEEFIEALGRPLTKGTGGGQRLINCCRADLSIRREEPLADFLLSALAGGR